MILFRIFSAVIVFFASLLLLSCSGQQERRSTPVGGGERITIDASQVDKEVDISDWIEDIRIFPLEEVEGSMLGDAQKVLLTDKHLIILDEMDNRRIVVFDRGGKFVKALEIIGNGPQELAQITDCWLNNQGNLEVYDRRLGEILVFDDNFEVATSLSANNALRFIYLSNLSGDKGYVAFAGYHGLDGEPYKMAYLDNQLELEHRVFPYESELMGASISTAFNPFLRIDDNLVFHQIYDPRIYTVETTGELSVRFQLDYIDRPFPMDFEKELILENIHLFSDLESSYEERQAVFKDYSGFFGYWQESRDYAIFISLDTDQKQFISVYHKGKREIVGQSRGFKEEHQYKLEIPSYFLAAEAKSNRFVTVMPAFILSEYYLSPESPFYPLVIQDPETLFVLEMELKD